MLAISDDQLAAMDRDHMIDRVYTFIKEHAPDPATQALLASSADCRAFWLQHYHAIGERSEHGVAVRLAYLLAARAHGLDPGITYADGDDAEIAMKSRMEQHGVLAFAAFDA